MSTFTIEINKQEAKEAIELINAIESWSNTIPSLELFADEMILQVIEDITNETTTLNTTNGEN